MPNVFFSYSHADEPLRDQLEKQLAMLKRQGVIETWHDRRIGAGQHIGQAIDQNINTADIILLLVSADFIASDYCYDIEMKRALERHHAGDAVVIPVILRACDWHHAPFGQLNATPRDGKPITQWPDIDEAFLQVAQTVRAAVGRKPGSAPTTDASPITPPTSAPMSAPGGPRSSNLRVAKIFTQRDKDRFQLDTFEYMAKFFENSLSELGARNPSLEGDFRRVDANRFFATVYRDGKDIARATVYMGGGVFGQNGICYINGQTTESNSMNESLRIEADDQTLFLVGMGMARFGRDAEKKLSQEGAVEFYWGMLIEPLQQRRS